MKKILLVILSVFFLFSCTQKGSKVAFEGYMKEMQEINLEKMKGNQDEKEVKESLEKMGIQGDIDINSLEFMTDYFKLMEYKIISIEEKGDSSVIKIKIKIPNISDIMFKAASDMQKEGTNIDMNDMMKYVNAMYAKVNKEALPVLREKKFEYIEKEVTAYLVKKDGEWTVDEDDSKNMAFVMSLVSGLLGI